MSNMTFYHTSSPGCCQQAAIDSRHVVHVVQSQTKTSNLPLQQHKLSIYISQIPNIKLINQFQPVMFHIVQENDFSGIPI